MISPTISDKTAAGSAVTCRAGGFFALCGAFGAVANLNEGALGAARSTRMAITSCF